MADPVTASDVAVAERLFGVAYSDAERALVAETIARQIAFAVQRRAVAFADDLAPATRFDPRLPSWRPPVPAPFQPLAEVASALPGTDADIAFASVTALAHWIRGRQISSARLTEIYLERLARIGPALECVTVVTDAVARDQARRADRLLAEGTYLGPLHGIPYGCKDIIDTAGIVTGWGAEPYQNRVPAADAAVVKRLVRAGAVLIAKTTVGALAYGDIWYGGRTRNPWNLQEGSSGSSAGSASATAAGLVGFSLGTETLGSIVSPSIRCGTTGLRPTFGRVSRAGAMALCWSLDKIGPICRAVEDTALVLAAIEGFDADDAGSIAEPLGYDSGRSWRDLRVGYYPADFDDPDADPQDGVALAAARDLGLALVPLERPALPYASLMSLLTAEAAARFEALTLSHEVDTLAWQEPEAWPTEFRRARFLSAVDHVQLDRLRRLVMQQMEATFRGVDAIIGPCLAGPMLVITNFTGHPCLTLRSGFRQSPSRGKVSLSAPSLDQGGGEGALHTVPHAICVWGRLFDEGTILTLGNALERAFRVAERRPPTG